MLFRELITNCEKYETHIWADTGVLNVEGCSTYCSHSPLKGKFPKSAFSLFWTALSAMPMKGGIKNYMLMGKNVKTLDYLYNLM